MNPFVKFDSPPAASNKPSTAPRSDPTPDSLPEAVTCPNCWHRFAPEDCLSVAEHASLIGDCRLGPDHAMRFLPSRFNAQGHVLDPAGMVCHGLACPRCHLKFPRSLFETQQVFTSILGAPSSGKSYFLASMTWMLRKSLPKTFNLAFGDADPSLNTLVRENEERHFLDPSDDRLVEIAKTEIQGELYNIATFAGQTIYYPKPFIFTVLPAAGHPQVGRHAGVSLCLYDNAGEHFLPGADTSSQPGTRHLASSEVLMFLFDPTQDRNLRRVRGAKAADPQWSKQLTTTRQETILHEAAMRIRRDRGLPPRAKHDRPLFVLVTKFDAWRDLLGDFKLGMWWKDSSSHGPVLNLTAVERASAAVRAFLVQHCHELVSAAEEFASNVVYIPVSALGRSPEVSAETKRLAIRPKDIDPIWAEVPMLLALSRCTSGLVRSGHTAPPGPSSSSVNMKKSDPSHLMPPGSKGSRKSS